MRIYVVRHGETDWNRARRLQGRSDIPLNEQGLALAEVTGEGLCDVPFDLCLSSPLTRAKQTALCLLKKNHAFMKRVPHGKEAKLSDFTPFAGRQQQAESAFPLLTDERIMEVSFGSWEGLGTGPDNMEVPAENFPIFFRDPSQVKLPDDAETTQDVIRRTADFLDDLNHTPAFSDKTILITTHGFATRALLNPFYENRSDFWQGHPPYNCAVNVLETDAAGKLHLTVRDRVFYDPRLSANFKE